MEKRSNTKKIIGLAAGFVLVIALLAAAYYMFREKPQAGGKTVEIAVVYEDGGQDEYTVGTDAKYLEQAMDEAEDLEYSAEDGQYGAVVTEVNNVEASFEKNGTYWAFFVNDEYCNYGISQQPVEDGDMFKIVYTVDDGTGGEE